MNHNNYKIVYLLGAGASCKGGALPLVADYCKRLEACGKALEGIADLKEYMDSLLWLGGIDKKHNTVDSFAKWCWKNDKGQLERLRKALAFFFTMEELVIGVRDPRYIQFITEITDDEFKFPRNVKIINWNYDSQVQLACDTNKRVEHFANRPGGAVHVPGIINYYPTMSNLQRVEPEDLDMIQMNGIARMYRAFDDSLRMHQPSFNEMGPFMNSLKMSSYDCPTFNFAFERSDQGTGLAIGDRINYAKDLVKNADVVVIIGYSFPSVNDVVDNALFEVMKQGDGIQKIYLQSPSLTIDGISRRFNLPETTIIEPVQQLDSFYVALEYRRKREVNEPINAPITRLIKRQTNN